MVTDVANTMVLGRSMQEDYDEGMMENDLDDDNYDIDCHM